MRSRMASLFLGCRHAASGMILGMAVGFIFPFQKNCQRQVHKHKGSREERKAGIVHVTKLSNMTVRYGFQMRRARTSVMSSGCSVEPIQSWIAETACSVMRER